MSALWGVLTAVAAGLLVRQRPVRRWVVAALAAVTVPGVATAELVFTAYRDGMWVIHRQETSGAVPVPLQADLGGDGSAPALSPDGSRVAFEIAGQGILVCLVQRPAECRSVRLDDGSTVRPAWNPQSGELVFARYLADARGEDADLFATRDGLDRIVPLVSQTGNQDDPDVSPDGRLLAYSSAQTVALHRAGVEVVRHLWVMDLTSGVARLLVPGVHQDMHPDWSPDGKRLAFASDRSGQLEIWVVGADGEGLRQLTGGPGAKSWPAWSPDGRSLLFVKALEGRESLWVLKAEGGGASPLAPFGADSEVRVRDPDWR